MSLEGLTPLPAEEWGDAEHAAFGRLLGLRAEKVPRAGSGHAYDPVGFPVVGLLVRHPDLAGPFLSYNGYLLQRGELPVRLRELAILRITSTHRCAYIWGEHVDIAVAAGLSPGEVDRVARAAHGFLGDDELVLEATDQLLSAGRAAPETWDRLVEVLGTHAAMELIFVTGTYAMLCMAFETWQLPPKPGMSPLPDAAS